jgi:hypothetical protein
MHQIISGATHKTTIASRKDIQKYLDDATEKALQAGFESCLYESKKVIANPSLNFLNLDDGISLNQQLKFLLRNAYDECEKIYPYMGDIFIRLFFNDFNQKEFRTFKFNEMYEEIFVNSIRSLDVREIARWFLKNSTLDRNVLIEPADITEIILKKKNNINLDIEFDPDFLSTKLSHTMEHYRHILIDGFIESIGEIHHLLHTAAATKEPHVIFCFGMSDDVKNTIINNNNRSITEIFPVVIKFDESTVNILNDLAVIHDCDVVSALKGQTISQEVRKKLPVGKKIEIFKNKIVITPVCDDKKILSHRMYLKEKLDADKSRPDIDVSCLISRIKNFSTKTLIIYVPRKMLDSVTHSRSLDYFLRFLSNIDRVMTVTDENILLPFECLELIQKKVNSVKNMYNNIHNAVLAVGRT